MGNDFNGEFITVGAINNRPYISRWGTATHKDILIKS